MVPDIVEGPPPDEAWDYVSNHAGWTGKQMIFQLSFEVFDALPARVRHALHEAIVTFEPQPIAEWVIPRLAGLDRRRRTARSIIDNAVAQIRWAELDDIRQTNLLYRRRWRMDLPHVAAGASILRYYSARRRRR